MQENNTGNVVPSKGGVFQDLLLRVKLMMRLMGDSRVNFFLKLIPLGSVAYLFFPDLLPGPVDDAAILWMGTYLFVELCPPQVVEEHLAQLKGKSFSARPGEEEIIEGEWREQR
jgi:hypothetical protein